jgi:hypothetical protein
MLLLHKMAYATLYFHFIASYYEDADTSFTLCTSGRDTTACISINYDTLRCIT